MPLDAEDHVVVIGAGQAGMQVLDSLRGGGYAGRLTVISEEAEPPYQRPPLSKELSKPGVDVEPLPLRAEQFFEKAQVDARLGVRVERLDRHARQVRLSDGSALTYTHLILATGALNRSVAVEGAELDGVHSLRTRREAEELKSALSGASHVAVIGAGFIGLEVAAGAKALGRTVTVLEYADRPMARALTPTTSVHVGEAHRTAGIDLRLQEGLQRIEGTGGRVTGVVGTSGARFPADVVLVGVGVVAAAGLAEEAGLEIDNGIAVDEHLRTSDPRVFAVGDCASFPNSQLGRRTRLESVQNATDQARHLAALLTGQFEEGEPGYSALPWFWSDQGSVRIQIAGLVEPTDETIVRGEPAEGRFSVFAFRGGVLSAVESVNSPRDHMAARKILSAGMDLGIDDLRDPDLDLRSLARARARV